MSGVPVRGIVSPATLRTERLNLGLEDEWDTGKGHWKGLTGVDCGAGA